MRRSDLASGTHGAQTAVYAVLLTVVNLVTFPVAAALEMDAGLGDRMPRASHAGSGCRAISRPEPGSSVTGSAWSRSS